MKNILLALVLFNVVGCRGRTILREYPDAHNYVPLADNQEVFLTAAKEIPVCKFVKIADIRAASKVTGSDAGVKKAMREMARQKGGNAVIGYNLWFAPNGFSWAAPQAEGIVVSADLNCLRTNLSSGSSD